MSPPAVPTSREFVLSEALSWQAKLAQKDCSVFGQGKSRYVSLQRGSFFGVGTPQEDAFKLKIHIPWGMGEDKEPQLL